MPHRILGGEERYGGDDEQALEREHDTKSGKKRALKESNDTNSSVETGKS